jgi:uncharacterized membrane protein YhaH (DUF805 family)
MKIRVSDLWRWDGTIDRGPYAVLGVSLMVLKYALDAWLTRALLGQPFTPLGYWTRSPSVASASSDPWHATYGFATVAIALPFVWAGIVLTVRRLRSTAIPAPFALFFFIPFVNMLFFCMLCALPPFDEGSRAAPKPNAIRRSRWIPESQAGSAVMSVALVVPATGLLAFLSAQWLGSYGWGLFVGLPFFVGLVSALIYGYSAPRSLGACVVVALAAIGILACSLFLFAIEGAICIVMAAPIAIALALLGALIGWSIQQRPRPGVDPTTTCLSLSIAMPCLLAADAWLPAQPPEYAVETSIDIDAPRERVWSEVVAFSQMPPPTELLFRSGIAYPMRAEIDGHGVGAVRRCVFSTGAFVEPIEVWDEPQRLEFSVAAQPRALNELMPWPGADPPHVTDYFVSRRGRFDLVALDGGGTRLVGTTWYTHRIWPAAYWRLYSDWLLHRIHRRVLEHIRDEAECAESLAQRSRAAR